MTITRVTEERLPRQRQFTGKPGGNLTGTCVLRSFWRLPGTAGPTLEQQMAAGKRLYLLTGEEPVGVISMGDHEIGDLYVLPRAQGRGYGTMLLRFAMEQCGSARLTVLSSNTRALAWYKRNGFARPVKGGQAPGRGCGKWNWSLESYHD